LRYRTTGCRCQGRWLRGRRLAYLAHYFSDIIFDRFQKWGELRGPTLDTVDRDDSWRVWWMGGWDNCRAVSW
jgi:hypothetical protein